MMPATNLALQNNFNNFNLASLGGGQQYPPQMQQQMQPQMQQQMQPQMQQQMQPQMQQQPQPNFNQGQPQYNNNMANHG